MLAVVIVCFHKINNIYIFLFLYFYGKDWFAFLDKVPGFNFTILGETFFPNRGTPSADENFGFCKVIVSHNYAPVSQFIVISEVLWPR